MLLRNSYIIRRFIPFFLKSIALLLFFPSVVFSQELKRVDILRAGALLSNERIAANAQRLIDSVLISHKNILIWCDSAYTYTGTNRVDAFGNVHIQQDDTMHLYSQRAFYDGDKSFARAWGNVMLKNKKTRIYSDTIDYDIKTNIGYYDDKGRIVDSTTTITSQIGKYFVDKDLMFLLKDVVAVNDDFTLNSDTLNYNTKSGLINIQGPTTIRDSSSTMYAESGWYDSNTGEAELLKNPVLSNETQNIKARLIKYNKEKKSGKAFGEVRIEDMENKSIIMGHVADYNDEKETALVTDSAVYISYSEKDTLFLHADTLRSVPDTIPDEKIITAFHGVRFFRNDMQGMCDSMIYFTRDSLVQLHRNPVIWYDIHQLSSNLIELKQMTDSPDELHLTGNSFIISKLDSGRYDQIKGKEMVGYIVDKKLKKINVNGNGQTLYYAREDSKIIGLNRAESSKIEIGFNEGKVSRIIFLSAPEGELKPLFELKEEDKTLKDFKWLIEYRPLSKNDIFAPPPSSAVSEKEKEMGDKNEKAPAAK